MRIGVICPYDLEADGGVQQLCREIVQRLVAAGGQAVLAGPGHGRGWISLGSSISVSANRSRVPLSLSPAAARRIRNEFEGFDVLHVHEPLVPLVGWGAMRCPVPTVVTFHADPPDWVRGMYRRFGSRLTATFADTVLTAVSNRAADPLPADWGPVEVIPNAVDVGSYRVEVERRPKRVVFLGRDDPRKGLDVVLDAWPTVLTAYPDAELMVIGASRRRPQDGVHYAGRVREPEKRSLLASSSVFVAPNTGGESFGIVVVEAMAAGCAVLASDLDAFREVAGHAAAYAAVGDASDWAEQLITLLSSPDWRAALQRAALHAVERFDWSFVLDRYRDAYRRALAAPSADLP